MIASMGFPSTSVSVNPNSDVAALFQERMFPSASPEMMASMADSMTDRNFASDSRRAMRTLETVTAGQQALDAGLGVVGGSHEDDREVAGLPVRLEVDQQVERVGVGEMGVQQHEVGAGGGDAFERVGSADGPLDGIPVPPEQALQRIGAGQVIIDDKD